MPLSIFDLLKDICFKKHTKFISNLDEQVNIYPYMLQRWISMADNLYINIINNTTNRWVLSKTFDNSLFYKFYLQCLPKIKQKKILYIKKNSNITIIDNIQDICNTAELSQREIKEYIKHLNYE